MSDEQIDDKKYHGGRESLGGGPHEQHEFFVQLGKAQHGLSDRGRDRLIERLQLPSARPDLGDRLLSGALSGDADERLPGGGLEPPKVK